MRGSVADQLTQQGVPDRVRRLAEEAKDQPVEVAHVDSGAGSSSKKEASPQIDLDAIERAMEREEGETDKVFKARLLEYAKSLGIDSPSKYSLKKLLESMSQTIKGRRTEIPVNSLPEEKNPSLEDSLAEAVEAVRKGEVKEESSLPKRIRIDGTDENPIFVDSSKIKFKPTGQLLAEKTARETSPESKPEAPKRMPSGNEVTRLHNQLYGKGNREAGNALLAYLREQLANETYPQNRSVFEGQIDKAERKIKELAEQSQPAITPEKNPTLDDRTKLYLQKKFRLNEQEVSGPWPEVQTNIVKSVKELEEKAKGLGLNPKASYDKARDNSKDAFECLLADVQEAENKPRTGQPQEASAQAIPKSQEEVAHPAEKTEEQKKRESEALTAGYMKELEDLDVLLSEAKTLDNLSAIELHMGIEEDSTFLRYTHSRRDGMITTAQYNQISNKHREVYAKLIQKIKFRRCFEPLVKIRQKSDQSTTVEELDAFDQSLSHWDMNVQTDFSIHNPQTDQERELAAEEQSLSELIEAKRKSLTQPQAEAPNPETGSQLHAETERGQESMVLSAEFEEIYYGALGDWENGLRSGLKGSYSANALDAVVAGLKEEVSERMARQIFTDEIGKLSGGKELEKVWIEDHKLRVSLKNP